MYDWWRDLLLHTDSECMTYLQSKPIRPSSVNLTNPLVNLPNPQVNLPGLPVNLPGPPVHLPDPPVNLPDTSVNVPDPSVNLPVPPVDLPDPSVNLPDPTVRRTESKGHQFAPISGPSKLEAVMEENRAIKEKINSFSR